MLKMSLCESKEAYIGGDVNVHTARVAQPLQYLHMPIEAGRHEARCALLRKHINTMMWEAWGTKAHSL